MLTTNSVLAKNFSRGGRLEDGLAVSLAGLSCREIYLERGAQITPGEEMVFAVLGGWVCGQQRVMTNKRQICSLHIIGDIPDLRKMLIRATNLEYQAITPCRVSLIPVPMLHEMSRHYASVAKALEKDVARASVIAEGWITNIGARRAVCRVAHLFCELAYRLDMAMGGAQSNYSIPLTQCEIGNATGITPVHVNRVMQVLRGTGLLQYANGRLVILDREELEEIADFDPAYLKDDAI